MGLEYCIVRDISHLGINTIILPYCLKKNMNASRPSQHPPVRGEMSKRLDGIIGRKYKTFSWHLNGFPDGSNIV